MPNIEGEVSIRRYNNGSECDVIVAFRGPHPAPHLSSDAPNRTRDLQRSLISGGFFFHLNVLGRLAVAAIRPCSKQRC